MVLRLFLGRAQARTRARKEGLGEVDTSMRSIHFEAFRVAKKTDQVIKVVFEMH